MLVLTVALAAVLGLLIGSFLNVVIWRVPRGESINRPPSHCPRCGAGIKPYDNVPVVSWLVLRGRCRSCGAGISPRYPLVELATGALFAGTAVKFGPHPELPAYLYLAAIGVALAMIDFDTKRLPNVIVLPSYGVAVVLLAIPTLVHHEWSRALHAVIWMAVFYGFYFVICFITRGKGLGFGDVKLAGVLGLYLGWLGWQYAVVSYVAGALLGGVVAIALIAFRGAGRKTQVPYGPFLIAGALIAVLVGAQIAHAYAHTTGVS